MIKAIIFDFYGVFRPDGFKRWLKQHGYSHDGAYLEATERHDRGEYSDKDFFNALSQASGETAEQIEKECETGNIVSQPLVDFVSSLQGTYKLALLSNASSAYLRDELAKYKLSDYFDEIVISSEVGLIKPEPEVFAHIMEKLHVIPNECIFVDDNPRYIKAAELLGIHTALFTGVNELKQQIAKIA